MSRTKIRDDTNFVVTTEQIGRLERSLLSLRRYTSGRTGTIGAIAEVQYQEILRLRAELDSALGFLEQPCDLMVSLSGPTIGQGAAPASAIAGFFTNMRAAMQAVSVYLETGLLSGRGRLPQHITQPTDFQFAGAASGSIRLKLNLPEPKTLFPEFERENTERGLKLILHTVEWTASSKGIEDLLREVDDERLTRLLLSQVQRVAPTVNGAVLSMEFSGRLTDPDQIYVLSRRSSARIRDAFKSAFEESVSVVEEGKLRSVDIDSGAFTLRQRPDDQPDLRCIIPREILSQAIDFLLDDATVAVSGELDYDKRGRATSLRVEEIYEVGGDN